MSGMPTDPLAPPPTPPVERLNRTVLLVAALIVMITLLVVAFLVSPRATPRAAGPLQPPPTAGAPGFLNRPPGNLPPSPRPPLTDQDYLRSLLEQAAPGTQAPGPFGTPPPGSYPPPSGLAAAPPPPTFPSPAAPALPPPPRDQRREEFLRALRAPLAEPLPPPALPRGIFPEADRTSDPGVSRPPGALLPTADSSGASAPETDPDEPLSRAAGDQPPPLAAATRAAGANGIGSGGGSGTSGATRAIDATGTSGAVAGAAAAQPAPSQTTPSWPTPSWPAPPSTPLPPSAVAALAPRPPRPAAALRAAATAGPGSREPGDIPVVFHPASSNTTLAAGTLIPALLETEINSDLPGSLLAQVSRDVYDLRQRSVVVPRGTRLLGAYQNQVAVGQRRLLVAWTRLTFPDGSGFDLPGLPATDPSGAAGLTARVQNHLLRVFGDALLLSLLSAGADLSQPQNRNLSLAPSAGSVASAAVGQELASVGVQLLRRDLSLQPTLRLAAGTPFLVFVNGDLPLAPPVALIDRGRRP
jgi:type IV secretory pathway VirB10-like protein